MPEDEAATLGIFARAPLAGRTKTRLAARLGDDEALAVYRELVRATCRAADQAHEPVVVHYTPAGAEAAVRRMIGRESWRYVPQLEVHDLGARMLHAFAAGSRVLLGTDCPSLDGALIDRAFALLESHDMVLGPALDGGYYLIGARQAEPALFDGVAWSTGEVLERTRDNAGRIGWRTALLPERRDIDTYEDYRAWRG